MDLQVTLLDMALSGLNTCCGRTIGSGPSSASGEPPGSLRMFETSRTRIMLPNKSSEMADP